MNHAPSYVSQGFVGDQEESTGHTCRRLQLPNVSAASQQFKVCFQGANLLARSELFRLTFKSCSKIKRFVA